MVRLMSLIYAFSFRVLFLFRFSLVCLLFSFTTIGEIFAGGIGVGVGNKVFKKYGQWVIWY